MKESIEQEDRRIRYIYFPVKDESCSMSEMLLGAYDRAEMERIGKQIREHLMQIETEKQHIAEMKMLRDGKSVWQIINERVPVEMRTAYDACGRLRK